MIPSIKLAKRFNIWPPQSSNLFNLKTIQLWTKKKNKKCTKSLPPKSPPAPRDPQLHKQTTYNSTLPACTFWTQPATPEIESNVIGLVFDLQPRILCQQKTTTSCEDGWWLNMPCPDWLDRVTSRNSQFFWFACSNPWSRIHGTIVYLPTWMVVFFGKCRYIYHTWMLWVNLRNLPCNACFY